MILNVLLLVYSGTGNTRYLARRFEAKLRQLGHRVTMTEIDRLPPDWRMPEAELVGLGTPVYHTAPPAHVLRFLERIDGRGVPLFSFLTMGLYAGDCARMLQQAAAQRGFRPVAGFEAVFPGSDFAAQLRRGSWINRRLNLRITRNLTDKVARFCEGLSPTLPERIEPARWYVPLNDLVKPRALNAYEGYKRALAPLPERCTQGGWCVEACPEQAISFTGTAVAVDPARCSLCFRCYHGCPEQSLVFFGQDDRGRYAGPQEARDFEPLGDDGPQPVRCERPA